MWQNRLHFEEKTLWENIEAISKNINQKVKVWAQIGLPNGQQFKYYTILVKCGLRAINTIVSPSKSLGPIEIFRTQLKR